MIRSALVAMALVVGAVAPAFAAESPASTCYLTDARDAKASGEPAFVAGSARQPRWSVTVYADEPQCTRTGEKARATAASCTLRDPAVIVHKAAGKRAKTYRITTIGSHAVQADAKSLTCTYLD